MNKTGSKKIADAYRKSKKLKRYVTTFSGVWDSTMDQVFPLFCPAAEADWIPGWTAEVLHSDSDGYVSEHCIFRTDASNKAWGEGIWYFTSFKHNDHVEAVRFQDNMLMMMHIDVTKLDDGRIKATWHITASSLNAKGDQEVAAFQKKLEKESQNVPMLIDYYLKNGTCYSV